MIAEWAHTSAEGLGAKQETTGSLLLSLSAVLGGSGLTRKRGQLGSQPAFVYPPASATWVPHRTHAEIYRRGSCSFLELCIQAGYRVISCECLNI
jgi:hypothetical protein